MELTSGDIAEITGLPLTTLARWIASGIIDAGEDGRGNYREWTFIEAVAIAYAERWRQAGCGPAMVGAIFEFVSGLGESRLRGELKAGNRIVLPEPGNVRLLPAKNCSILDLNTALEDVEAKIKKIRERGPAHTLGRRRGLHATG
jgi:hypothetical protein